MNTGANNHWASRSTAVAIALPFSAAIEVPMRERLGRLRDTLIVLGMQLAFRTAQFLRHLNY
jgi:hypothetical protein